MRHHPPLRREHSRKVHPTAVQGTRAGCHPVQARRSGRRPRGAGGRTARQHRRAFDAGSQSPVFARKASHATLKVLHAALEINGLAVAFLTEAQVLKSLAGGGGRCRRELQLCGAASRAAAPGATAAACGTARQGHGRRPVSEVSVARLLRQPPAPVIHGLERRRGRRHGLQRRQPRRGGAALRPALVEGGGTRRLRLVAQADAAEAHAAGARIDALVARTQGLQQLVSRRHEGYRHRRRQWRHGLAADPGRAIQGGLLPLRRRRRRRAPPLRTEARRRCAAHPRLGRLAASPGTGGAPGTCSASGTSSGPRGRGRD